MAGVDVDVDMEVAVVFVVVVLLLTLLMMLASQLICLDERESPLGLGCATATDPALIMLSR